MKWQIPILDTVQSRLIKTLKKIKGYNFIIKEFGENKFVEVSDTKVKFNI